MRSSVRQPAVPDCRWCSGSIRAATADTGWTDGRARTVPDLAVANSHFTAQHLARWFPDTPVEIVYCPFRPAATGATDPSARHDLRRSLDTPQDDVVITQVGRLESLKGYREALEALATLRDVNGWTYWTRRRTSAPFRRLLPPRAEGGGRAVGHQRSRSVYRRALRRGGPPEAADVYCQPNIQPEAFGISLVEAQAAGLPIVTSDLGGALEIVDDTCGRLVPPGDIGALAAALRGLMNDPSLRSQLGHSGRARSAERWDLARQMMRTHEVLSSVAGGRRPMPARPSSAVRSSAHS